MMPRCSRDRWYVRYDISIRGYRKYVTLDFIYSPFYHIQDSNKLPKFRRKWNEHNQRFGNHNIIKWPNQFETQKVNLNFDSQNNRKSSNESIKLNHPKPWPHKEETKPAIIRWYISRVQFKTGKLWGKGESGGNNEIRQLHWTLPNTHKFKQTNAWEALIYRQQNARTRHYQQLLTSES